MRIDQNRRAGYTKTVQNTQKLKIQENRRAVYMKAAQKTKTFENRSKS